MKKKKKKKKTEKNGKKNHVNSDHPTHILHHSPPLSPSKYVCGVYVCGVYVCGYTCMHSMSNFHLILTRKTRTGCQFVPKLQVSACKVPEYSRVLPGFAPRRGTFTKNARI